jgi:hypothetical protein
MSAAPSDLAERPARVATGAGLPDPLPAVRRAVQSLLLTVPAFTEMEPDRRRELANAMVRVCQAAALLLREQLEGEEAAADAGGSAPVAASQGETPASLARTQAAGQRFSGVSAAQVAATTRGILNAVSFPRFVTDLINGVFRAMVDSTVTQMNSYVELLNNVAASAEGYADANLGGDQARAWLAERYPGSFEVAEEPGEDGEPGRTELRLRDGASMPSPGALRVDLGLGDTDPDPTGDPERSLVPLARRQLAKRRQETLATMVMLGMQRVVVDSGRITAAMRFHVDTRSAAQEDEASKLDLRHSATASASFGVGAFGFSGTASHSIGYVSTQRNQTTEEMNTDLELNSSVEVNFRTDQVPLDRMTSADKLALIRANTLNPAAEARTAETARRTAAATSDRARQDATERLLAQPPPPPPPKPGAPGSIEAADAAKPEPPAGGKQATGKEPPPQGGAERKPPPQSGGEPPKEASKAAPPPQGKAEAAKAPAGG